jgi:hypothetical protein
MATTLIGKKIACLVAPEGVEQQAFDHLTTADRFGADVVRGRTITSWSSLRVDLRNAGAKRVDAEVVECSRGPKTLVVKPPTRRFASVLRQAGGSVRHRQVIAELGHANVEASVISRTC